MASARYINDKDAWDNDNIDEIVRAIRQGNQELRAKLILAHKGLVKITAGYYSDNDIDTDDLISYGTIGLMKYIDEKYKPDRDGRNFQAGAISWIRREIMQGVRELTSLRTTQANYSTAYRVNQVAEEYYKQNGREPSIEYLAEKLHISIDKINKIRTVPFTASSLDKKISGDDYDDSLISLLPDATSEEPPRIMEAREEIEDLFEKADLTSKERELIQIKFGLYGRAKKSFEQMGREYGLTKQRVEQKVREALKKVKIANGIVLEE